MFKTILSFLVCGILLFQSGFAKAETSNNSFAHRKEVQAFVQAMHQKHGFDPKTLTELFKAFGPDQKVLSLMSKPYEALPWYQYRDHVVNQKRIEEGVRFWKENKQMLQKAEQEFGVPAEIIVAIIGIESNYGQIKGKYPVFQSLSTLAFDFPRRAEFFKGELEQFLLLTREENFNPKEVLGSYAGAMGIPQFMPSNYRRYAVDFSGRGQRDLLHNVSDVIGSVANYFKVHGWKQNQPVIHKASVKGSDYKSLAQTKDLKPSLTLSELAKYNVKPHSPTVKNQSDKFKLIAFEKSKGIQEHWLARDNFYVITRYNKSSHYAMAVYLLSERIRTLR